MHRDFQSQNIHLLDEAVRLIDFQGMRLGPLGYDIMSLVMDPYQDLPAELKEELLARFCVAADSELSPGQVRAMTVAAGLQRLMQALGAFGFLGHVKGKPAFLQHIPRAVAHLCWLLRELDKIQKEGTPEEKQWLPSAMPTLVRLVA